MGSKSGVTSLRQQSERTSKKRSPAARTWWHRGEGENSGTCSLASQSFPTHGGGSERGLDAVLRVPGLTQCLWALPSCSPVALSPSRPDGRDLASCRAAWIYSLSSLDQQLCSVPFGLCGRVPSEARRAVSASVVQGLADEHAHQVLPCSKSLL